jgi:hypothetical protein
MSEVNPSASIQELLRLLADNHQKKIQLSDEDKQLAVDIVKRRALDELEYGEEIEVDKVRLIKRVTGAVGIYFSS